MHMLAENLAFMLGAGLLVLPVFASALGDLFYPLLFLGFLFGAEVSRVEVDWRLVFPFVMASYLSGLGLHLGVEPVLLFPLLLLPLKDVRGNDLLMVVVSLALVMSALGLGAVSQPVPVGFDRGAVPLFLFTAYFAFFTDSVKSEELNIRKVALALSFVLYTLFTVSTAAPYVPTLVSWAGRAFAVALLVHSLLVVSGEQQTAAGTLGTLALLVIYSLVNLEFIFQVVIGGVAVSVVCMVHAVKNEEWRLAVFSALPLLAGGLLA
jgi:hypothetical protein